MELHNLETERSLLAALMLLSAEQPGRARLEVERERLTPERFYLPAHQEILRAVLALEAEGKPGEPSTIWPRVKGTEAAQTGITPVFLSDVMGAEHWEHAIPSYAEAVRDLAMRRRIVSVAQKAVAKASDLNADAGEALAEATGALASITRGPSKVRTVRECIDETLVELDEINSGKREPVIPTGIVALDAIVGGLQPTLIVLGAQPGAGKSAFIATVADNLAKSGRRLGVFCLEDESRWIAWRLISNASGVAQFILRNRKLVESQRKLVADGCQRVWNYGDRIIVDGDGGGMTSTDIVESARNMVVNLGCRAIFIDHLGEIRTANKRRDRADLEVAESLADLRDFAKRYRVPIVVAAHLKRREQKLNKQGQPIRVSPSLQDFAETAYIERKARVALGLMREPNSDVIEIAVLKQTNGVAGASCRVHFEGAAAMIADCEGQQIPDWYGERQGASA